MDNPIITDDTEAAENFVISIEKFVAAKQSDEVVFMITDPIYEKQVQQFNMDLLSIIGRRLNEIGAVEEFKKNEEWFNLENAVEHVARISSPKECLLILLDLVETAKIDDVFSLFTGLLKNCLIRLPHKRNQTLLWALSTVYGYIRRLPIPDYSELDSDERLVLDSCPMLRRINFCVIDMLLFCDPFISEARECKLKKREEREEQIRILLSVLLKLLDYPLAFCCYYRSNGAGGFGEAKDVLPPDCCNTVERVIETIFTLCPAIFPKIFDYFEAKRLNLQCSFVENSAKADSDVSELSIGVLLYGIFVQEVKFELMPCVYSGEMLFHMCLPCLNSLLKNSSQVVNCIGIQLGIWLTARLKLADAVPKVALESNKHLQECFLRLIQSMIYNQSKPHRVNARKVFDSLLYYFDKEGQISVVRFIFYNISSSGEGNDWNLPHMGIKGYLIDFYRKRFAEELNDKVRIEIFKF